MAKKSALGRGLNALITMDETEAKGSSYISEIELTKIKPNTDQPRRLFDEETLEELSTSIKKLGVVQPITVRRLEDDTYQIIAGERRYRASLMANISTIPAYVKTVNEGEIMEMALVENIQREDLNAIEIALAYQNLLESLDITQEQLSGRVGKKRTTISNYLRLLKLPADVQMGIKNKLIDMGHARALISLGDPELQLIIYNFIVNENLSVRKVEEIVRELSEGKDIDEIFNTLAKVVDKNSSSKEKKRVTAEEFNILKQHLSNYFKTPVQLSCNDKGRGKISITFASTEEMERIITMLDQLK